MAERMHVHVPHTRYEELAGGLYDLGSLRNIPFRELPMSAIRPPTITTVMSCEARNVAVSMMLICVKATVPALGAYSRRPLPT